MTTGSLSPLTTTINPKRTGYIVRLIDGIISLPLCPVPAIPVCRVAVVGPGTLMNVPVKKPYNTQKTTMPGGTLRIAKSERPRTAAANAEMLIMYTDKNASR